MKRKIFYGILILIMCVTLVGCGNKKNESENKDNISIKQDEKKDQQDEKKDYHSIDELPSINDYKTYTIDEASKEEWFSNIAVLGKRQKYNKEYHLPVTFGHVDVNTELEVPDSIIIQYSNYDPNDKQNHANQIEITKDMFVVDNGYKFLKNMMIVNGYSENEIDEDIIKKFTLSMKQSDLEKALAAQYDKKYGTNDLDVVSDWHYNHLGPQLDKIIPIKTSFDLIQKTGELGRIIMFGFKISDFYYDSNKINVILVYDKYKANINTSSCVEEDNGEKTCYKTDYEYYSPILDEEANEIVKSTLKR